MEWFIAGIIYAWGCITTLLALEMMEEIAVALNSLSAQVGAPQIGMNIRGRIGVRMILVAMWPVVAVVWLWGRK